MNLLEVKNVKKSFGGLHAVDDVCLDVKRNSIKAIIGPNGAGKTTLFNLITGTLGMNSGEIFFKENPIHGLPPYRIARKGISRTFQNVKLFAHMTVIENVMIGRHVKSKAGFFAAMFSLPWTWKEEKRT